MEDHRCNGAEEGAHPGNGEALSPGHRDSAGVKTGCHGNAVALGCGCHCSAGVQAEGRGQGWLEELSFGSSGTFGGSQFLPRGESSAPTGCRLDRSK